MPNKPITTFINSKYVYYKRSQSNFTSSRYLDELKLKDANKGPSYVYFPNSNTYNLNPPSVPSVSPSGSEIVIDLEATTLGESTSCSVCNSTYCDYGAWCLLAPYYSCEEGFYSYWTHAMLSL